MKNCLLVIILFFFVQAQIQIKHEVFLKNDNTHFVRIKSTITNNKAEIVEFHLPVWTPGSYLVREYAKDIHGVKASDGKNSLTVEKSAKNVFLVESKGSAEVSIEYEVYGYTRSVRTNHFTDEHAFIVPAATFMFVPEMQNQKSDISLSIHLNDKFKKVATGLSYGNVTDFKCSDLDVFYDCPIEIGNFNEAEFELKGIKHRIAITEIGNYDLSKLAGDMKKIVESVVDFFDGQIPYEHYTFLINLENNTGGGLEHLNSTALQASPGNFKNPVSYVGFLDLVSHEFFHAWNVKRIRPIELGPFNYDAENYTSMLWLSEGFTDYCSGLFPLFQNFSTADEFVKSSAGTIAGIFTNDGYKFESPSETSFDAWIKFYRKGELQVPRSRSSDYYGSGSTIAMLIDLKIIDISNGKKSIKDVFIKLFARYNADKSKGITLDEFKKIVNEVAGKDLVNEFALLNSHEIPNFSSYFEPIGITYSMSKPISGNPTFNLSTRNGVITEMLSSSYLFTSGLSLNDELIAIDNYRVTENYNDILDRYYKIGDSVKITVSRAGRIFTYPVVLAVDKPMTFTLTKLEKPTKRQKELFEKWTKKR